MLICASDQHASLLKGRGRVRLSSYRTILPLLLAMALVRFVPASAFAQDRASLIDPPHNEAHAGRAIAWCGYHLARGELVAALSDCNYAVARDPKSIAALSNRGSVYLIAGEPARAMADFDAAIQLAPKDADLYFNRGIARAELGQHDQAIADYTLAIQLKPDLAIAFHNRGYEHESMSRLDDALADYQRALALRPDFRQSLEALERLRQRRQ